MAKSLQGALVGQHLLTRFTLPHVNAPDDIASSAKLGLINLESSRAYKGLTVNG